MLPSFRRSLNKSFLSAALGLSALAGAATFTWDTATTAGIQGGAGTWNTQNTNWNNGTTNVAWANTTADVAIFSVTGGIVTVAGPVNVGALTINATGYTIADSTLNFGATNGVITTSGLGSGNGLSAIISSAITGTAGLTFNSHGNLSYNGGGNSSFTTVNGDLSGLTGGITINSGLVNLYGTTGSTANTITLNGGGLLANASGSLANNVVLTAAGGVMRQYGVATAGMSGNISGVGALTKTDLGILNLSGTNSYTGGTLVGNGTINVSGDNGAATGGWNIGISNGGTNYGATVNFMAGSTVGVGAANRIVIGADNGTGGIVASVLNAAGTVNNAGALFVGRQGTLNINGGALWNQGGAMTVATQGGYVATFNLNTGATLNYTGASAIQVMGGTTGNVVATVAGTLSTTQAISLVTGTQTGIATLTVNGGTIRLAGNIATLVTTTTASGGTGTNVFSIGASGATIDTNGFSTSLAMNVGGGAVSLTKAGAGTLTLGGTLNQFVTVNGGTLTLTGGGFGTDRMSGAGVLTMNAGTTLIIGAVHALGGNNTTMSEMLVLDGATMTQNAEQYFNTVIMRNATVNGTGEFRTASASNIQVASGTSTIANTVSLVNAGSFTVASGAALTINGVVSNVGAFVKAGAGNLTLAGTNTYTGATTVNGGTLTLNYGVNNTSKLADGAVLTLGGGGIVLAGATGSHLEAVASTTLSGGASISRSGANTARIALGAITRAAGGTLDVATAGLATTTTANVNGILAGVTFGGSQLAMNDGAGNIVAYNGAYGDVTRLSSGTKMIGDAAGSNVRIIDGTSGAAGNIGVAAGTTTIGTLTHTATGGPVTIAVGGVLRLGAAGTIVAGAGTGDLNFAGGTLTAGGADNVAGDVLVTAGSGATVRVGSVIANNGSGAVNLSKSGAGTMILTGANTYANTVVGGGILQVGNGSTTGSLGTGTIALNGGTLVYDRSDNVSLTQVISGGGDFVKNGGGTLTLGGVNTFSGNIVVNGGTLASGGTTGDGTAGGGYFGQVNGARTITVNSGATLSFNINNVFGGGGTALTALPTLIAQGGTITSNNYTILGNVTLSDGATIASTLTTTTGFTGFEFKGGGTVTVANTAGTLASQITAPGVNLGGTVTFNVADVTANAAADLIVSSIVTNASNNNGSVAGNLVKTGAGTMALTGANTYTGTTTIAQGTLQIGNAGAAGSLASPSVINNGVLAFNRIDALTYDGAISGSGTLEQRGIGNLTLTSAASNFTGAAYVLAGTLTAGAATTSNSGSVLGALTSTRTIHVAPNATLAFTVKDVFGTSAQSLASIPVVSVEGGTFTTSTANVLGSVVLNNGGLLTNTVGAGAGAFEFFGGTVTVSGIGAARIAGTGAVTLGGGTNTVFNVGETTGDTTADLAVATVLANGSTDRSGAGSFTKSGAGTMVLLATNTYTGTTTVSAGTLAVGDGTAVGSLGTGGVILGGATLAFNRSDAITVANAISGTGVLTQIGAGTTTLTGANSYTGQTSVVTGTLRLGAAGAFGGAGALDVASGATFDADNNSFSTASLTGAGAVTLGTGAVTLLQAAGSAEFSGVISGTGSLTMAGAGTAILSGGNTYTGATTVAAGVLQLGNGGASGSIASTAVTVDLGAVLAFNRSDSIAFTADIGGTGGVTQRGTVASVVTLSGINTYTGVTRVESGTLRITAATAFAGGDIFIGTPGVFEADGANLELDLSTTALTGTGALRVTNGDLTLNAGADSLFDGSLTGSGTFTKTGAGNFTVTGSGTFGGDIVIEAGSLVFGGATGGITAGSGVVRVINPGSLVFDHTQATTFAAGIVGEPGATFVSRGVGATTVTGVVGGEIGVLTEAGSTIVLSNTANVVGSVNNAGTTTVAGDIRGAVNVSSGVLTIGTGIADTVSRLSGTTTTVAAGAKLVFAGASQSSVTGISGDGIYEQAGGTASILTITGDNSAGLLATSTVRFTSGSVAITDATNVGDAKLEFNGGKLIVGVVGGSGAITLNNAIETLGTLSGAATLSYLTGNQDLVLDGTIGGTGYIRYSGPGTLTGANLPSPRIIEDQGTIELAGQSLATTNYDDNLSFTNGGAFADLIFQQNENGTSSGTISGNINLVKNGEGELRLIANNTYAGTTTVNDGTLRVGDGNTSGSIGTGAIVLNGGLLLFDRSDTVTIGQAMTGAGVVGSAQGELVLTGEINVGGLNAAGGDIRLTHTAALTDNVSGAPNQTPSIIPLTAYATALTGSGSIVLDAGVNLGASEGLFSGILTGSGALTKTGTGTLTVSGNGNVTGGVSVLEGTLQLGANGTTGTLGQGDMFVAATGTIAFSRADAPATPYVYNGIITGSGQVAVTGSGVVAFTGTSNYSGKTTVASGATLRLGNNGSTGSIGSGLVQNDGMLEFAIDGPVRFNNTIAGTGGVRQTTAGTLTLAGNNTYSGLTEVLNGGNIILNTAFLPQGDFKVGANSTLTFTGTGAGTIRGNLSGDASGTVALTGTGNVVTIRDSSYQGRISIASGATLKLGTSSTVRANLAAGEVLVQSGGRLTGYGYIAGNLRNQGVIAPGFSPGVIAVGGNFVNTGTLNMEIAGAGAAGSTNGYDQIRFGGVATLGGTLNIAFTNGFSPAAGYAATLLQDTAPVAGQDSFVGDFINVNVTGGTGRLIRGSDAIVFFSGSSMAQITGLGLHAGVDAFANALTPNATLVHPDFTRFITLYTSQGAGALAVALQNASPVGLAALTALPTNEANKASDEIRRRAESQTMASSTPFGDDAAWLAYAGGSGFLLDTDSGSSSPSFDSQVFGGYAALERRLGDGGAAIGVRFSYDNGTADLHNGGGKITQDRGSATVYALAQLGERGYVAGTVGMGYSNYDTKRNTLTGPQKASPSGWDVSASVDAGYVFRLNREWSLTPHAGLSLVTANVGGFTERGDNLALAVDSYSQDSVTTRIGTGLVREWAAKNFTRDAIRVGLDISYEHTLFGDTADIPASFANVPVLGGFKSDAPSLIKDSLVIGPQVQWVIDNARTVSLGYRFQYGFDGSTGHRADISFEQRF